MIGNLPVVWFTDNEALAKFLDNEPPLNARLRRAYLFLSQFSLRAFHLPGIKNELCDYLSRNAFQEMTDVNFETLAREAFAKMDTQIDLWMHHLLTLSQKVVILPIDYEQSTFAEIWKSAEPYKTVFQDGRMYFKSGDKLFCERKLVVPKAKLVEMLKMCHDTNNHPGTERTLLFFLQNFFSENTRTELLLLCKNIVDQCQVCLLAKPNKASDRGEVSSLPIPQLCNDTLYVDFVQMDAFNNFDYVLVVVDALSRFVQCYPCQKAITGEGVLKLLLERWISPYGKPLAIHSDNDVRFKSEKGFYQTAFKAIGVEIHFALPRHPASNGLCERENRAFLQNLRALSISCKTMNWPQLVPYCVWLMNSQISTMTELSPHEMFLGRPPWKFELVPEPCLNPQAQSWLMEQLLAQEKAALRLKKLREVARKRTNKGRVPNSFKVDDYVLVHKKRWPQHRWPKLLSPWQGPFKVMKVHFNSLQISASPSLGGVIDVSMSMCKKWSTDLLEDSVLDEPEVLEDPEFSDIPPPPPEAPPASEVMTPAEQEALGFYNVEKIIKHKFQQGWKFLVVWEGFPVAAATWEPISAFILPNGSVNTIFKEYCLEKGLTDILKKALSHP